MSDEKMTKEEDNDQLKTSFGLYHLMRNCGLILRRMGQRFDDDAFDAVNDVLEVLPHLLDDLIKVKEGKDGLIKHSILQPFDRTRHLRNLARMFDMLPNENEDWEAIPIEVREKGFKAFAKHITEYIEGE
jgi:hypothetical protein